MGQSLTPTLDRLAFAAQAVLTSIKRATPVNCRIADGACRQSGTRNKLATALLAIAEDLDHAPKTAFGMGSPADLSATLSTVHGYNRDWPHVVYSITDAVDWTSACRAARPLAKGDWHHQYGVLALLLRSDRPILQGQPDDVRVACWAAWCEEIRAEAYSLAESVPFDLRASMRDSMPSLVDAVKQLADSL